MLKRLYDFLAVVLILAGLFAVGLTFFFLYNERFIEGVITGLLGFVVLRSGLLLVRLLVARNCLEDSHRRIISSLSDQDRRDETARPA